MAVADEEALKKKENCQDQISDNESYMTEEDDIFAQMAVADEEALKKKEKRKKQEFQLNGSFRNKFWVPNQ